jgi:hypothetical protein
MTAGASIQEDGVGLSAGASAPFFTLHLHLYLHVVMTRIV